MEKPTFYGIGKHYMTAVFLIYVTMLDDPKVRRRILLISVTPITVRGL